MHAGWVGISYYSSDLDLYFMQQWDFLRWDCGTIIFNTAFDFAYAEFLSYSFPAGQVVDIRLSY